MSEQSADKAPAFTPGPWEIARRVYTDSWRVRTKGTQLELAEVYEADDETPFPVEANAALISAAPDLYTYLEIALGVIEKSKIMWMGADGARAALRKALGQST